MHIGCWRQTSDETEMGRCSSANSIASCQITVSNSPPPIAMSCWDLLAETVTHQLSLQAKHAGSSYLPVAMFWLLGGAILYDNPKQLTVS